MNPQKVKRLKRAGWAVGDAAAFLQLSPPRPGSSN